MEKSKVICLDGGGYLHRAIFAYRNNPAIPSTYTYMRMIIGDLKKVKFTTEDIVIIAQDYGRSWRKDLDTQYKLQRKGKREQLETPEWWKARYEEFNKFFDLIEKILPWHFVKIYRMESDDIASVVSRYYTDKEVILMSSDRDWEMLANFPNVKIFSPISKKYKDVPNPMKILLEKIQGDVSDNLLNKPSSEMDFEIRNKIVNLLELPEEIEKPIKEQVASLFPKNLYLSKVPFHTVRVALKQLYEGKNED